MPRQMASAQMERRSLGQPGQRHRLVGVGLGNCRDSKDGNEQSLFSWLQLLSALASFSPKLRFYAATAAISWKVGLRIRNSIRPSPCAWSQ
jgi:hypothetical protein